jgi:CHAD domain-containing protein
MLCLWATVGWLLALSTSMLHAGLDLSPQSESYQLEGIEMLQLAFNAGTKDRVIYQPPRDWKYSGGKDRLDLQPKGTSQVKATVTKLPPDSTLAFDREGGKRLTENLVASLPEGSEQVKVQSEELNPLRINGKQTYLVEVSYTYYGERFVCYSLMLDRKPEPISFRLSCRESDYQALREAFQKSLYSWQNL